MKNERFYCGAKKYDFERSLARHTDILTKDDQRLIRRYVDEMESLKHISETRSRKLGFTLIGWKRFITVPWNKITTDDVFQGIAALKTGTSYKGKPFTPNTLRDFVKILKAFVIWLNDEGIISVNEKKIKAIRAPKGDTQTIVPADLLTPDEIKALVKAAPNDRDRALILTLYESGCRIGELARLAWRDLVFDEYGVRLYVSDTKTDKRRYARLTMSTEALAALKNSYPDEPVGDAFVFLSDGAPMTYIGCTRILQRAARKAGIKKPVRPHLFRHSRVTAMIRENYQESIIKESLWGNPNTSQFKTYLSLSETDIDREFLKRAGIETSEKEAEVVLKPRPCGRCHTINGPTSSYCSKCGQPLTEQAATSLKEAEKAIELMPEYREILESVRAQLLEKQAKREASV